MDVSLIATDTPWYLSNGVVDVTAVIAVAMVIVQITKGWLFDSWMNPTSQAHEAAIVTYDVVLTAGLVALLMWAGGRTNTRSDWVSAILGTIVAAAAQWGLYARIKPFPSTPTDTFVNHATTHVRDLMNRE